jgi:signal transduction histidine kinase
MHPRVLEDLGLQAALARLARESSDRTGIDIEVDTAAVAAPIPTAAAWVLFRVAQEAIANATRHASAGNVLVRLAADERAVTLEVVDDGRGFDPSAAAGPGLGLFTMRERVALADGTVEVTSSPGNGTRVSARVPQPR